MGAFKLPGSARLADESKDLLRRKVSPSLATESGGRSVDIPIFSSCWNGNSRTFGRGMIFDGIYIKFAGCGQPTDVLNKKSY